MSTPHKTPLLDKLLDRNLLKNGDSYDKTFVWLLLCLLCFGLVMVYSASGAQAGLHHYDNRGFFLIKQAQFALLGLAISFGLMRVPMWRWQRWTIYLLLFTLLVMIFVPFTGEVVNGARRWLPTPFGFKIQPSELFKFITIMYMASFFKRRVDILHDFRRVILVGIPIAAGITLVALTRDLGSAMVIVAIFLCLLYLASIPMKWFWGAVAVTIAATVLMIITSEFRMHRMEVMWQPWKDPTGTGYQGLGSLLSMNQGDLLGTSLGNAIMKRGFLPEAHTDFILAVIGEELGLIAVAALTFVYLWIIWRAFSIGKQARDLDLHYNSFIATGVGVWVAAQSFVNIGVNISLLPNKGLTLPLVSYGGSSLIIMLIAFTMLLRVDHENRLRIRGYNVADPRERKAKAAPNRQPENNSPA
ncbi:putative lipid II flippase FtsW [Kingella sp. (in: b-proteobacteria)]|uniref:putative lipid II flippase FtsW n=1 Tax=Kingella sp. (in: b-proteobacteria) TaxID=2020713 RepID=UPI0026DC9421|nr:putative lipid II flippase FtsW [Kingella sp. (in: b-proteobacteria)]MDO4657801.1 putative lipid II flippase FtsW [Kingella sp. (in: b-proteobacteria)]